MKDKQSQMKKWKNIIFKIYDYCNNMKIFKCIRECMLAVTPIILIGAFALILYSFPVEPYLNFIRTFAGGILDWTFRLVYHGSFGALAIYMVIGISIFYCRNTDSIGYFVGAISSSMCAFLISSGVFSDGASLSGFTANGIFTAIICGLLASGLFHYFSEHSRFKVLIYTYGADSIFHSTLRYFFPMLATILCFLGTNVLIYIIFGENSFQDLYVSLSIQLFENLGRNFGSAFLYVLLAHVLWFMGIHGTNVFESVTRGLFEPALAENIAMLAQGNIPSEIYSKTFLDVFVLMGGCGTTMSLMIAIFLFSRKRSSKALAKIAVFPGIFNINELLVFGLPVVFNPIFLIPFLMTPVVSLVISAAAMSCGLVPVVTTYVEWTTPVLLSGYISTGSVRGLILQLVNLLVGVLIYYPFIRLMDEQSEKNKDFKMKQLVKLMQESENSGVPVVLLERKDDSGILAKNLAEELKYMTGRQYPTLYYQPQFDHQGNCIGAEALLRWKHSVYGMIYPPLVVQLAQESQILCEFEKEVLRSAIHDMETLKQHFGAGAKISVNVTGTTIQQPEYEEFLVQISREYPQYVKNLAIEITEQAVLKIDDVFIERLARIRALGFRLLIDDFSMGHTSIKYLQTNSFSIIKLDGSLTRDILKSETSRGIVKSLAGMADEFGLQLLAEYVETREQQKMLEELGCCLYQGYLYSPAVPLENLSETMSKLRQGSNNSIIS